MMLIINYVLISVLLLFVVVVSSKQQQHHYDEIGLSLCGQRQIRNPKIVGGHSTYHGQHPWAVSIRIKYANNRHHCGGALINNEWILTAAHCVASFQSSSLIVRLGGHSRFNDFETGAIDLPIKLLISHEQFTFSSFNNDIALLKLSNRIEFNRYIQPICLPFNINPQDLTNKKGTVVGWGRLTQAGQSSTTLNEVELPIISNKLCQQWYEDKGRSIQLQSTQFCAGFEQGGRDACQGDSGGPMILSNSTSGQTMVIGVVSAGIGCALQKLPGLYTKVSEYLQWITHNIQLYS